MTTQQVPPSDTCRICQHGQDEHLFVLVPTSDLFVPMGVVRCPEPGCQCGSTWRAGAGRSTPEEIAETRILVREALARAGVPIPAFLR